MNITKIENITQNLSETIDSMNFIINVFDEKLFNDFYTMRNNNYLREYKELYSLKFLLKNTTKCLEKIRLEYSDQINSYYKEK